jgi:hypothetical protein
LKNIYSSSLKKPVWYITQTKRKLFCYSDLVCFSETVTGFCNGADRFCKKTKPQVWTRFYTIFQSLPPPPRASRNEAAVLGVRDVKVRPASRWVFNTCLWQLTSNERWAIGHCATGSNNKTVLLRVLLCDPLHPSLQWVLMGRNFSDLSRQKFVLVVLLLQISFSSETFLL